MSILAAGLASQVLMIVSQDLVAASHILRAAAGLGLIPQLGRGG